MLNMTTVCIYVILFCEVAAKTSYISTHHYKNTREAVCVMTKPFLNIVHEQV